MKTNKSISAVSLASSGLLKISLRRDDVRGRELDIREARVEPDLIDILSCAGLIEGPPKENSVPLYPLLLDAREEDGWSYRYFCCLLPPCEDFELTEEARLDTGLSGITLSLSSDSS